MTDQEHASELVATPATQPQRTIRDMIKSASGVFEQALPKAANLTAERFTRIAITAVEADKTGKLAQCSRASLIRALIQAAEVGLEPGSALGTAYLIPYWNKEKGTFEAQLQIGTWGFVALAKRSEDVADVWSDVVYEADEYEVVSGTENRKLVHRPKIWLERGRSVADGGRGLALFAYACAKLRNGDVSWRIANEDDCQQARKRSAGAGKAGPWSEWEDEMRCKVAIKRARKYWPQVIELARAIQIEDDDPKLIPAHLAQAAVASLPEAAGEFVAGSEPGVESGSALSAVVARSKASEPMREPGED